VRRRETHFPHDFPVQLIHLTWSSHPNPRGRAGGAKDDGWLDLEVLRQSRPCRVAWSFSLCSALSAPPSCRRGRPRSSQPIASTRGSSARAGECCRESRRRPPPVVTTWRGGSPRPPTAAGGLAWRSAPGSFGPRRGTSADLAALRRARWHLPARSPST